jgi:hypothetical protein
VSKNLIRRAGARDRFQDTAFAVIVEHGLGKLMIGAKTLANHLRIVVVATAANQAFEQGVVVHVELDDAVQRRAPLSEQRVERLGLLQGPREAIEQAAAGAIAFVQAVIDHIDDQRVGHQAALIHVPFRLQALHGAITDRLAENIAGGDVRRAQMLQQSPGLRSFACSRRSDEDDAHDITEKMTNDRST